MFGAIEPRSWSRSVRTGIASVDFLEMVASKTEHLEMSGGRIRARYRHRREIISGMNGSCRDACCNRTASRLGVTD